MKRIIAITLLITAFTLISSCEYEAEKVRVKYDVRTEEPIDLYLVYKVGEKYQEENVRTPFEYAYEVELNDDGWYYFFVRTTVDYADVKKQLFIYIYADGELWVPCQTGKYNTQRSHTCSGYISNGKNTSTVTIDFQ